jgi:hypothetical protein
MSEAKRIEPMGLYSGHERAAIDRKYWFFLIWLAHLAVPPILDIAWWQQAATSDKNTFGDKMVCGIAFR